MRSTHLLLIPATIVVGSLLLVAAGEARRDTSCPPSSYAEAFREAISGGTGGLIIDRCHEGDAKSCETAAILLAQFYYGEPEVEPFPLTFDAKKEGD